MGREQWFTQKEKKQAFYTNTSNQFIKLYLKNNWKFSLTQLAPSNDMILNKTVSQWTFPISNQKQKNMCIQANE